MFVGHALLAFAIVALLARRRGVARERALQFGVLGGLFAAVPDVDVVYAPFGLLLRSVDSVGPDVFWATANLIHRGPTHSLVMGAVLALAVGLWVSDSTPARLGAIVGVMGLVTVAAATSGVVGALVTLVFGACGLLVAALASHLGLGPRETLPIALVGLLSHPFGDLFTGSPPPLLYPIDLPIITERILLHPDPTGHLLAAFAVELGTVWLAVWTVAHFRGERLSGLVSPRAALGAGYAVAVFVLPAPTLEQSAHFVFSVLALGFVGAPMRPFSRGVDLLSTVVTGLTAVTIAALTYALLYGLL